MTDESKDVCPSWKRLAWYILLALWFGLAVAVVLLLRERWVAMDPTASAQVQYAVPKPADITPAERRKSLDELWRRLPDKYKYAPGAQRPVKQPAPNAGGKEEYKKYVQEHQLQDGDKTPHGTVRR